MLGHNEPAVVLRGSILSMTWIRRKDTLMNDIREFANAVACDDTVSVSERDGPPRYLFAEVRGGP